MSKLNEILDILPKTNKKVVSILSGGLDSTILTYLLKKKYNDNVIALTIDYGQRHVIELEKSKITTNKLNIPHNIIKLDFLGEMTKNVCSLIGNSNIDIPDIKEVLGDPQPNTMIPFRNMLFTTIALSFAESNNADYVYMGIQAHDLYGYWDTTPEFLEAINNITKLNRLHDIKLCAPFISFSKSDEIKLGLDLNVPFEDTWTCYSGPNNNNEACATCASCAERIKNFMDVKIKDPILYAKRIPWKINKKYKISFHHDELFVDEYKIKQILNQTPINANIIECNINTQSIIFESDTDLYISDIIEHFIDYNIMISELKYV